jgi:hypothetical protein
MKRYVLPIFLPRVFVSLEQLSISGEVRQSAVKI